MEKFLAQAHAALFVAMLRNEFSKNIVRDVFRRTAAFRGLQIIDTNRRSTSSLGMSNVQLDGNIGHLKIVFTNYILLSETEM